MRHLTDKQEAVLDYLRANIDSKGRMPSLNTIARAFGWRSNTAALGHINALVKKGRLERDEWGQLRFTNLDRI